MGSLVDSACASLRLIEAAMRKKEATCGSWHAPNDPSLSLEEALEQQASRKVVEQLRLPELEARFEESLSEEQQALREKMNACVEAPEIYDESDARAATEAYNASLSEEQRQLNWEIAELRLREFAQSGLHSRPDKLREAMQARLCSVEAETDAATREDLGAQSILIDALLTHLRETHPEAVTAIRNITTTRDGNWRVTPSDTPDAPLDFAYLEHVMRQEIGGMLSRADVWKPVSTRLGNGFLLERPCGTRERLPTADVLFMSQHASALKEQMIPIFRINGAGVTEDEFYAELDRRHEASGDIDKSDFSGLTNGYLVVGPEGRRLLQEKLGIDIHAIRDGQSLEMS